MNCVRKYIFTVIFTGILFLSFFGRVLAAAPTNGLVGYWNFDEGTGTTAADTSGNGNNGTISGATWAAGKINNSLTFNGVNNDVTVGNKSILNITSSGTISAWIKSSCPTNLYCVIAQKGSVNVERNTYSFLIRSGSYLWLIIADGANSQIIQSNSTIPQNLWTNVTATWDGTKVNLYINGVADMPSVNQTVVPSLNSYSFKIGEDIDNGSYPFSGAIDDVRVYNRALSGQEVLDVYNDTGVSVPQTAPSIATFTANPNTINSGQTSVLSWSVSGNPAPTVSINNGVGAVSGNSTTISPSTSTVYTLTVTNSQGTVTANVSVTVTQPVGDTQAPSVPTNLSANPVSANQINLSWQASTDNIAVVGYVVYRNAVQIATTTSASYNDTGLLASTLYSYTVRAFDQAGNYSAQSGAVTATTQVAATPGTINAVSCSQADVQTAINSATSGNTVFVPAGNCTWASPVNISIGISLIGAGKTATIINNQSGTLVTINKTQSAQVRVSGFRFNSSDSQTPIVNIIGPSFKVRVDNMIFNKGDSAIGTNWLSSGATGPVYGVVDHSEFYNMSRAYYPTDIRSGDYNWGTAAWAEFLGNEATFPGSEKMMYFEDNQFNWNSSLTNLNAQGALYGSYGGKAAFRHNTFTGYCTYIDAHGDTPDYSTIYYEIYNNTFIEDDTWCYQGNISWQRGGQWIIHDNTFTGSAIPIRMSVYYTTDLAAHRVKNTYIWGNTWNGNTNQASLSVVNDSGQTPAGYSAANIRVDQEYFLHAPQSGQMYYPYSPYVYPHPLVSGAVTPTYTPGDFNHDGAVNSLDYSLLNANWFKTTNISIYDLQVDGIINSFDYAIFKSNWGR